MFYLRSKEQRDARKALVPFTQPLEMGNIVYNNGKCYGRLTCHDHTVFEASFRSDKEIQARNRMCDILETIITYLAEHIENAIEEGEIEGIIDLENWKEDILGA